MGKILRIILAAFLTLALCSCMIRSASDTGGEPSRPVRGCGTLEKIPFREAWYGMYFKDDKVGYSHFKIEPEGRNFVIRSDSIMRLTALKKTREIDMNEKVTVHPDLTLISFESNVRMNNKDLHMIGKPEGKKFVVNLDVEGEKSTQEYPLEGKIFHSSAINLMPIMRGLKEGERYSFGIFNAERQGLENIEQEITSVRGEAGPNGAIWRVKNNYGKSPVFSWLDKKGLTVLEKAAEGALITVLEDEASARKFLETKTAGKDLIMDVSRIKIAKPLPNPGQLRYLRVKMDGVDPSLIAEDHRQRVTIPSGFDEGAFQVTVAVEDLMKRKASSGDSPSREYSEPTMIIQSDHKEIVAQASKITSNSDPGTTKISKLVNWTAKNIKNEMQDSFNSLSVLRSREGECESHANLYAAMARSLKIPTRVVMGIVYSENVGFLYHAWAESYADGWIAVDPTFNQIPADATHIKITSSDHSEEKSSVLKMAGKVKLDVLEYK
jgi:hypothetical protein